MGPILGAARLTGNILGRHYTRFLPLNARNRTHRWLAGQSMQRDNRVLPARNSTQKYALAGAGVEVGLTL
jgi:hypothetical protein